MSEQKLSEKMAALKAEAEARVKGLLWDLADADEIAEAALRGGVDPARVDKLAADVAEACAALATATAANSRLPELQEAHDKATDGAKKAAAKLAAAEQADNEAREALGDIETELQEVRIKIENAARVASGGAIPPDAVPAFLGDVLATWKAEHETAERSGKIATLKQVIRWRKDRVEAIERELEALQKSKNMDRQSVIVGGRIVDAQPVGANRLKNEREALKKAEKELKALEKSAA